MRAKELGLTNAELKEISSGMLADLYTEKRNDGETWAVLATQEDMDNF